MVGMISEVAARTERDTSRLQGFPHRHLPHLEVPVDSTTVPGQEEVEDVPEHLLSFLSANFRALDVPVDVYSRERAL